MTQLIYILKELKYTTHKNSTVTYVFDVVIKSLLGMSCKLRVACDEMRKRHFIDKIDVKTTIIMKKTKCEVNNGEKVEMINIVHVL